MIPCRTLTLCVGGATVLAALATGYQAGLRVNATPSMPIGIWQLGAAHVIPKRGDIVSVCLPDGSVVHQALRRGYITAGTCPSGAEPLVKPVAAIGGDLVSVSATGISVDATPIANTRALVRDEAGRVLHPMAEGSYRVVPDEVWLLSDHDPRSFDSRYFGAVPAANVLGIVHPLWVLQ
jgi:conjugative transfer signal peptidase TraF